MTIISPEDLSLVALGVVIWVVALSVAFSFYLPVLRAERRPRQSVSSSSPPGLDRPASDIPLR
ncbi:MAG: hypothetical protein JWP23_2303 [Phenylobacterium sp.]|nr:hypothetical protein [Phenylobacterium sp.]